MIKLLKSTANFSKLDNEKRLINLSHSKFWSRFFVFTVTVLVILVLLSIWGANFLEKIVNPISFANDTQAIIEIYPEVSDSRTTSKQQIVLNYLQSNPNIESYKIVSQEELSGLLSKWTSVLNDLSMLPLPIIINVSLQKNSHITASDLQLALSQQVSDVYVESEKSLANKLTGSLNVSRGLILLIPLIIFFIVFGLVVFVILGLIYSHKKTIEVLSFLGASYIVVAKEYSLWVFKNAAKGCLLGFILTIVIVELFVIFLHIGWIVIPSATTFLLIMLVIILVPIEATIITFFVVRAAINWVIK
ncbi:hypothetical protein ACFX5K_05135 [Rickettsiales bacterium LUAb2]